MSLRGRMEKPARENKMISPQLLLAITLPLPLFSIGYLILRSTMKALTKDVFETLAMSLFMGSSTLITSSVLVGTLLGTGLKLLFYAFYFSGVVIFFFQLAQLTRSSSIERLRSGLASSKYLLLSLIFVFLSLSFYLYYPLNRVPADDAIEAFLPMARYFVESDGIPAKTSVYFTTGNKITIPPGISLVQAFAFTILNSFNPINLSFIEITFLFGFAALAYAFSKRCGFDEKVSALSMILMVNLPYWGYYFRYIVHYVDLESAFMTSASIYLLLILIKDKVRCPLYILPIVGVSLFATIASKLQSIIVLAFLCAVFLKLSGIWRKHKKHVILLLLFGYLIAVPILVSRMYIYAIIFGEEVGIILSTGLSIIPLIFFLKTEFQEGVKMSLKRSLLIFIPTIFSLFWYIRTWLIAGSSFLPFFQAQTGNSAWAAETLKRSMRWGGYSFLIETYLNSTFNILHTLFFFTFFVPLIVGIKCFHGSKNFFSSGLKMWFLVGAAMFLGLMEKEWRYLVYFILPISIIVSLGLFDIIGKRFHIDALNASIVASLIFIFTFCPIDVYLTLWAPLIFVVSTVAWISLERGGQLFSDRIPHLMHACIHKVIKSGRKTIFVHVLILILLLSGVLTALQFQHCLRLYEYDYQAEVSRLKFYDDILANVDRGRLLISAGSFGLYYFTGVNTLNIFLPDELAVLRPLFNSSDFNNGLRFLVDDLKVGSVFLPYEEGIFHEWYTLLLAELPELRVFHNPHVFKVVHYNRLGYLLNLVNDTVKPYGVLDVVVRGDDPYEEVSLFLPVDYGQNHTFVAYSHEGLKLSVYLYFPKWLIERACRESEVTYNITTRLTIFENFKEYDITTTKVLSSEFIYGPSKIIQLEAGTIKGNDNAFYTAIRIDEIEIRVTHESFKVLFRLIPKSPSISFPGTWLTYFPRPSGYPRDHLWTHLCSNLVESTTFVEMTDQ